jgi:hypothetical protein
MSINVSVSLPCSESERVICLHVQVGAQRAVLADVAVGMKVTGFSGDSFSRLRLAPGRVKAACSKEEIRGGVSTTRKL